MDRANPAPLGLMGFGMTTVLLNLHNAGFFEVGAMIIAMGFFYGGMAQVFAGIMEFRKANTFGTTAFTSYGLFWISLGLIWILETSGFIGEDTNYLAWYLAMWGVFTAYMFIGTLKLNRALQVVFGTLTILFFLLAIGRWADSEVITKIAGWEGIFCGLSAIYAAALDGIRDQVRDAMPASTEWVDSGVDFSHYFPAGRPADGAVSPLLVRVGRPGARRSVRPVEQYSDLYVRQARRKRVMRVYCEPGDVARAADVISRALGPLPDGGAPGRRGNQAVDD